MLKQLFRLFVLILFISLIAQINILIADAVKSAKIKKQIMTCPPDCCTITADLSEYKLPKVPELEIIDIEVEPIE